MNFLRLKTIATTKQENLIPAGISAGVGVILVKAEQPIIESLPDCRLVLTSQNVPARKLRSLSKVDILIAKGLENLVQESLRT